LKKSDDVTIEEARDYLDRSKAHVGRSAFQADHHVFILPTGRRSVGELLPRDFKGAQAHGPFIDGRQFHK
jgi:hypothetical protein